MTASAPLSPLTNRKILVTGPTGVVGPAVVRSLARDNDVWTLARFSNPVVRQRLESTGITCVAIDLEDPDFNGLPDDFDFVVHMAIVKRDDFDRDMAANVEGTGLLMAHCRHAKAFLHVSSTAVYQANGHHAFQETDPLGDNHRVLVPTYSLCKIAAEAMARYGARQWGLPTTIARLNVPYGVNGGWPAMHLEMILAGQPIPVHIDAPSSYNPIHEDDIVRQIPLLLQQATVPATIVNWAGNDVVSIEEWSSYLGELVGKQPQFRLTERTLESVITDTARMHSLIGPSQVSWKDGMRQMASAIHPELR